MTRDCFHPSEYVQDEMDARGWDRTLLAWLLVLECSNPRDALAKFGRCTPEQSAALGAAWVRELVALEFFFEVGPTTPDLRMGDMGPRFAHAFGCSEGLLTNLETAWLTCLQGVPGSPQEQAP